MTILINVYKAKFNDFYIQCLLDGFWSIFKLILGLFFD